MKKAEKVQRIFFSFVYKACRLCKITDFGHEKWFISYTIIIISCVYNLANRVILAMKSY